MRKYFGIVLLMLSVLGSFAQSGYTYNPSVDGQGLTRPVGVTGMPTDARTWYHDRTAFTYRPFVSVAEVLSYLPTTGTSREGGFVVQVNTGGTLANGKITGGTIDEYWFKNGKTNGDLVLKTAGVPDLSNYATRQLVNDTLAKYQKRLQFGEYLSYDTVNQVVTYTGPIGGGSGTLPTVLAKYFTGTGASNDPLGMRTATAAEAGAALQKYIAYGDSMTEGTGTPQPGFNTGTPYMYFVQMLTGWDFDNQGIAGQVTDQIKARFDADAARHYYPHIFFTGTNDGLCDWINIVNKVQAMVDSLKHQRYLVIIPPGFSDSVFFAGQTSFECQRKLDSAMVARFGNRAIRLKQALMSAARPNTQDTFYVNHGVWPYSLGVDLVHLNDVGERILAQLVAAKIDTFLVKKVDERIVSNITMQQLKNMFGDGMLRAKYTVIGSSTVQPALLPNGGNTYRTQPLTVDGGASFLTPGGNGGIYIRPRFQDEGGASNMEITGTNPTYWPISKPGGLAVLNNARKMVLGLADNPVDWTQYGSQEISGGVTAGYLISQGGLSIVSGGVHNRGQFFTTRRVIDLVNPGGGLNGGIALPTLANAQEPGLFQGMPNEIFYNTELDRFRVGHKWSGNTNLTDYKSLATLDDIVDPVFYNGADISITGNKTIGYTISRASAPPVVKLNGTPFVNFPSDGGNADPALAFDGNPSTYTATYGYSTQAEAGIGLDLGLSYTITKIRIVGVPGQSLNGAVLQGSNVSSSSGFVDIKPLPDGLEIFNGVYNEVSVPNAAAYRYVRIKTGNATFNSVLYIAELEFYGYPSGEVTVSPTSALVLNSSKVLDQKKSSDSTNGYMDSTDHKILGNAAALSKGFIPAARIAAGTVGLNKIAATGPIGTGSNFLRDDGVWAPAGGGGGGGGDVYLSANNGFLGSNYFSNITRFSGIDMHYGGSISFKNAANSLDRININGSGSGDILVNNASGEEVARLSGGTGNLDLERGAELHLNDAANTVNNIVLKGADGSIKAASWAGSGVRMLVAQADGTSTTMALPSGGSGGSASGSLLQNSPAGDTLMSKINDSTYVIKGLTFADGTNITWSKQVLNNQIIYTPNITGIVSGGFYPARFNANYTVQPNLGKQQKLVYYGGLGTTLTIPDPSTVSGLTLSIWNPTTSPITLSRSAVQWDGSTLGTAKNQAKTEIVSDGVNWICTYQL